MSHPIQSLRDILHHSQNAQSIQQLSSSLKTFAKRDIGETIFATVSTEDGIDPLSLLILPDHTLTALYLLSARLNVPTPVVPWQFIVEFCKSFDPHSARHGPERITILARGIAYYADINANARAALDPLRDLLHRYTPNISWLTTIHPVFLKVCVATQSYTEALPVVSTPIAEIDKSLTNLLYTDNLVYHYLGGVVYMALRKFEEAEDLLEIAISAPGQIPSAIQLEALKKQALIQLILYGKTKPTSKYTNSALPRIFKQSPYQSLIKNYPSASALQSILEAEQAYFATDGNIGLIREVIQHAPRWIIRKLTNTYLSLSIGEIAKAIGTDVKVSSTPEAVDHARNLVLSMIERKEIYADLIHSEPNSDPATASVTFRDPPPPMSFDPAVLEAIVQRAQEHSKLLNYLDKDVGKNKEYLTKALMREKTDPMNAYDDLEGGFGGDPMLMRGRDWDDD